MSRKADVEKKTSVATRWSLFTEIAARLISPITNMVLARLLSPEAFGIVATVTMVVSFADIFTDAGFQKYLIQHDFDSEDQLHLCADVAFWTNIAISLALWGAISIHADELAALVGSAGHGIVLIVASASLPLTSFTSIQLAMYKRGFDFKSLFHVRVVVALVPLLVTVPIAMKTKSYWALVIGTISGNIVNALLLTMKSSWKPALRYSTRVFKEMFSYSWWILLESIAIWLTSYIDTFIVGNCLNDYYLGVYKTSMVTVNSIFNLIVAAVSAPLFSSLSRLKGNRNEQIDAYQKYIRAVATFLVPLGFGIWLYRDVVTAVLLGGQWNDAIEFIGMWGLVGSICLILGTFCNGLYNAMGKTYISFVTQILHLIVLVPAVYYSSLKGFQSLYVTRSIVRLELVIVQFVFMWIYAHISPLDSIRNIGSPLMASCAMVACGFLERSFLPYPWEPFVTIPICIIMYFAVLSVIDKDMVFESSSALGFPIIKSLPKRFHVFGRKDV